MKQNYTQWQPEANAGVSLLASMTFRDKNLNVRAEGVNY